MILKLSFLTYQKSTGGPLILTCWGNQTSKPFSVFRRTEILKFQCLSGGKPFKITQGVWFVCKFLKLFIIRKNNQEKWCSLSHLELSWLNSQIQGFFGNKHLPVTVFVWQFHLLWFPLKFICMDKYTKLTQYSLLITTC